MVVRYCKLIVIFTLLLSSNANFAQQEIEQYENKYSGEPFIYITKQEKINIEIKNCELEIISNHYIEKLSLQNVNQQYSDEYIGYSSFSEIDNIEAYFLEPQGKKYKKTRIQNIVTASQSDNSVFYDDYSYKRLVFPNMLKGCKSILTYTEKVKDPHLLGMYMFTGFIPVEHSELSITFPKEVKLSYKVLNDKDKKVTIKTSESKSKTTLTFSVSEYKPGYSLNNTFSSTYYLPHIIFYINSYSACGKNNSILENKASLYDWYYSLSNEINRITPEVKALSDSITNGISNDISKLKTIFYWVQDHIKYVAFEDGYEGFIPRSAEKVMLRKYGDCKDMANLTTQLLKAAGINAYLTWIGTRNIPYSYHEVPVTITDNHMICTAEINGIYYFLDATDYVAYDFPTEFIQSKEALIGKGEKDFEIHSVPIVSYDRNSIYDSLLLSISDHTLKGSGAVEISGYYGFDISTQTIYSNKENEKKVILNHVGKGSDKFSLDSYNLINFADRDNNKIIQYDFSIPDYVKSFNDKIYVNLNLSTPYSKKDIDKNNKLYAILIEKHSKIKVKNKLQIPGNHTVTYLPEPARFDHNQFGFSIDYTIDNNMVVYNFEMYLKTLKIEPENFEQWNQMIKALNQSFKKSIELTKIN